LQVKAFLRGPAIQQTLL